MRVHFKPANPHNGICFEWWESDYRGHGKTPYVIFSDSNRYWNIFEPICSEFDKRGIDVVYMTASPGDPVHGYGCQDTRCIGHQKIAAGLDRVLQMTDSMY